VAGGRVSAKLYLFLNAWRLSAATRADLRRVTRGSGQIWCYAPGYFDADTPSPAAMRELTGFTLRPVFPAKAWSTPTAAGRRLGLRQPFGVPQQVRPLFAATDVRSEEVLATYPDGSAAVALRHLPDGPSLFVGPPGLTPELLRLAAGLAGAHLFTTVDCCVYANGPYLALHAVREGAVPLAVGRSAAVTDILSGRVVGRGPRLIVRMKRGQTLLLTIGN
jgi:hypothetical protein